MNVPRLIERKRAGEALEAGALEALFAGYLDGAVPDYQMSAFLMAVSYEGLSADELDVTLRAMISSGESLELAHLPGPRVDKHSTGGVGDKVSLALAPLAAELGLFVPMMSGRGLGHTGGTLDKLEAIPGFRTDLPLERFVDVLSREGFAMTGQTARIAPLDRRLYDLRSVTGTVPAIPLIATSIMSKKLAEDLDALVLDVKSGSGAFLPGMDDALELASTMVALGGRAGVETVALVTAMDRPLGRAAGNALEAVEAFDCLAGRGPADLRDLTLALAAEMLVAGGLESDDACALGRAADALDSGRPLERMGRVVALQGGDAAAVTESHRLPRAPVQSPVPASASGYVRSVEPRALGWGVIELGGGRTRLGQDIDPAVGFVLDVAVGDAVEPGAVLGTVHARSDDDAELGRRILRGAVTLGDRPPRVPPLVSHRVTAAGIEAP